MRSSPFIWVVAWGVLAWGALAGTCWAGNGILKVITEPEGATVTVDSGQTGVSPCTLEVPEGKRSLHIKLRAYIAKNLQVEVSSLEPTEIKVKLVPIPTTLREEAPQYCHLQGIRDDGK
ncbi:MAG: PEGA domain-containing protein [candidate division NC10 bacterium]|nr:PEGA domain-containing protein [candidate division NC10 bacterium]